MILLSLGSNLKSTLGNRKENLKIALSLLETYDFKITKKSSFYETESYPNKSDPKFINMLISGQSNLSPDQLMRILFDIEKRLERVRKNKNDPRTCDIDIIDYKGLIVTTELNNISLYIPHQEIHKRNFVLIPLKEICPNWKHPKNGKKINQLIDELQISLNNTITKIPSN